MNHPVCQKKTIFPSEIAKITLLIILILCLLECTQYHNPHSIIFKGVTSTEIIQSKNYLEGQKQKNKLFQILLNELEDAECQIIIKFSTKCKIAGFTPGNGNSMEFQFKTIEDFKNENTLIEEFFHAFQALYYGKEKMQPNKKGQIVGGANLEYEARLLKAIMGIYNDKSIAETPSQKGLLDFTMSLMDKNGKIKPIKLTAIQHQKYIDLVIHFQQHWKKRNQEEGIKSIYDHPVDSILSPDACFYLIQKFNAESSQ